MALSINVDMRKKRKLSTILVMASMYAIPLMIAAFLYKQGAVANTSYALFAIAIISFIALPILAFKPDEKSNGFSVPIISDYPTVQEVASLPTEPRKWSTRLIREIEWKKFEQLCLDYFQLKGANARLIPKGVNGFIELRLNNATEVNAIVQHKTFLKDIGIKEINALLALMVRSNVSKGFYIAAGSFSDEAKALAKENQVTLISGGMLLTMLKRLRGSQQKKLLISATEGDYRTPTCPACDVKMISRQGPHQNKYYWGCIYKPKCKHIMPRQAQRAEPRQDRRSKLREGQFTYS